jgi:translation initiation factor IF-1
MPVRADEVNVDTSEHAEAHARIIHRDTFIG